MAEQVQECVQQELEKLVGLDLVSAARAADMRGFHFGEPRPYRGRTVGEFALHVQCAWRIDGPDGVITGRSDLWEPVEPLWGEDFERWDHERDGNLQDHRIAEWLGHRDGRTTVPEAAPENRHTILAVRATPFGGAELDLSGGYRLTLFPAGSKGEDWRLFRPGDDASHFVVGGGRIEDSDRG